MKLPITKNQAQALLRNQQKIHQLGIQHETIPVTIHALAEADSHFVEAIMRDAGLDPEDYADRYSIDNTEAGAFISVTEKQKEPKVNGAPPLPDTDLPKAELLT